MSKNTNSHSFLWGAATSSHQIDGHNRYSDWWHFERAGHTRDGSVSGAACDHLNRFRDDLKIARELNLNSYRFSIEWARLEPKPGRFDRAALDWYRALISECEKNHLLPMATLHHFTVPKWFADLGGFESPQAVACFSRYARFVATHLADRVPLWCTINEPMVLAVGGYLAGFMPPLTRDKTKLIAVCHNLIHCHHAAYDIFKTHTATRRGPFKDYPFMVGIAHNLLDFVPDRVWHPIENILTRACHSFYNKTWLDAITGKKVSFTLPFLFSSHAGPILSAMRDSTDFIGINYYTKCYVRFTPASDVFISISHARHHEKQSDVNWAIYPEGFANILRFVSAYKKPIFITENGIADAADIHRSDFLVKHLFEVARGIKRSIDIRGYYHWSLLDNFEWINGYEPRFGLVHVNYETQKRTQRKSAALYRDIIDAHNFSPPSKEILRGF